MSAQTQPSTHLRHSASPAEGSAQTIQGEAGFHLLPMWPELCQALPRLGLVHTISRNRHAILGGPAVYSDSLAQTADPLDPRFLPRFNAWNRAWFGEPQVKGRSVPAIEFLDAEDMGFHKIILTHESDHAFAAKLLKAFEQQPLGAEETTGIILANHLDGMSCAQCLARHGEAPSFARQPDLDAFLERVIEKRERLTVVLAHPALETVRTFIPDSWNSAGTWRELSGEGSSLFLRLPGIASLDFISTEQGHHSQVAALRDASGRLLVTLIANA